MTEVDLKALADIVPGDDMKTLAAAIGSRWRPPAPEERGWITYLEAHYGFKARLDRDGRVGSVQYLLHFDPQTEIGGVRMRMSHADLQQLPYIRTIGQPGANWFATASMVLPGGVNQTVSLTGDKVNTVRRNNRDAVYPEHVIPIPRPKVSFNGQVLPGALPRDADAPDGWCCGLPRGIIQAQWPLSQNTGHPLEHHFTVRVPAPYRVKGPQFVALAFFSETASESPVSRRVSDLMNIIFDGRDLPQSVEPELAPFLDHLRNRHPMDFRAKDILHNTFAVIWLTEDELSGAPCLPPDPITTAANSMCAPPIWLDKTTSQRAADWGEVVGDKWAIRRLKLTEVSDDYNTGRIPFDDLIGAAEENRDGYIAAYSDEWDALPEQPDYGPLHFGGTVMNVQGMPEIGPFFLDISDPLGEVNFGGGTGQLDLVSSELDWAQ
ncbi:MAG: hypothetical protein Q4G14_06825 [Paracoccus sp. (in: a-proteobacteria)]|uniref:DUF7256 domain-containing protein n=1 Tax=Paracoccus sp. TaxID=267 RepID=UPI0026E090A4|nr:hypothetical protein [Paracoccus sp. (in: a-proteobacteria)]MDO5612940.1 hypothetical protein [Paracoccus sp. (in: a-proteobacteria)]